MAAKSPLLKTTSAGARRLFITLSVTAIITASAFQTWTARAVEPHIKKATLTSAVQSGVTLTVDVSHPGPQLNKAMWGIFFEDINFGADGGLHAEMVKNRSFEFSDPLMGWKADKPGADNTLQIKTESPLNPANPHFLRLTANDGSGFTNEGFRGMGVKAGETYVFRIFARAAANSSAPNALRAELVSPDGKVLGSARTTGFKGHWLLQTARLRATDTENKAHLRIVLEGNGTLDLDMVSLYPEHTWKGRPFGLREDLVQRLADLKPGFVRFPGGCIVEGRYLSTRYQWKKTIGPQQDRETLINRWNDEFRHRPTPDYFQSFGLGFMEYFELCEDIGAEPLPVLNCGMACQFNSKELAPLDQLDPYVQDALDLIEFANGPVSSPWGAKRAALGHPKPFHMKLLGVGNEQWGKDYFPRYERFANAVKSKYPNVQLVTSSGPSPDNQDFKLAWTTLRAMPPKLVDIIDEHCYAAPSWFLDNTHRYDNYDRKGPKVFMGEFAAQSVGIARPDNRNDWQCALSEAAYMTGLERNGDVVRMSSYAPLLAHVDAWQWTPDLIWFDNLRSYATPNYYVQQLFMRNRGDRMLPVSLVDAPVDGKGRPRFYVSGSLDEKSGEVVLKVVNATAAGVNTQVNLGGGTASSKAKVIMLTSANPGDVNSLDNPTHISPKEETLEVSGSTLHYNFKPMSLTVLRVPYR